MNNSIPTISLFDDNNAPDDDDFFGSLSASQIQNVNRNNDGTFENQFRKQKNGIEEKFQMESENMQEMKTNTEEIKESDSFFDNIGQNVIQNNVFLPPETKNEKQIESARDDTIPYFADSTEDDLFDGTLNTLSLDTKPNPSAPHFDKQAPIPSVQDQFPPSFQNQPTPPITTTFQGNMNPTVQQFSNVQPFYPNQKDNQEQNTYPSINGSYTPPFPVVSPPVKKSQQDELMLPRRNSVQNLLRVSDTQIPHNVGGFTVFTPKATIPVNTVAPSVAPIPRVNSLSSMDAHHLTTPAPPIQMAPKQNSPPTFVNTQIPGGANVPPPTFVNTQIPGGANFSPPTFVNTQIPVGTNFPSPFSHSNMVQQTEAAFSRAPLNTREYYRAPHPLIAFAFGGKLISIFPRKRMRLNVIGENRGNFSNDDTLLPGFLKLRSVSTILGSSEYLMSLKSYPGPLTSTISLGDINKYIDSRISGWTSSEEVLLWSLMKLICKNYGVIWKENNKMEESISQLFVQSNPIFPHLEQNQEQFIEEKKAELDLQQLLISGNIQEAFNFALSSRMWPHALLLSSNISMDSFRNTVYAFATTLTDGSPMRTIYTLIAGKNKELVESKGWLDQWQSNLSILLAQGNSTSTKNLVGALGDKLWSIQRRVHAAHSCYLVVEHELGTFDDPNARLVLIGGDHKTRPGSFINLETIQRTEIFEFAKLRGNPQFLLPQIQVYKLIYAYMLAEVGLTDISKKYYGQLSSIVARNKGNYQYNQFFLNYLNDLGDRLNVFYGGKNESQTSYWGVTHSIGSLFGKLLGGEKKHPPATQPTNNPVVATVATNPTPIVSQPAIDTITPKKEEPKKNSNSPGLASRISGFLSPMFARGGTPQADLGEEISFEYNKELGMWVKKGQQLPQAGGGGGGIGAPPTGPPTEPPTGPPISTPPLGGGSPSGIPTLNPSGPPVGGNPFASSRRNKYVDTLNPDANKPVIRPAIKREDNLPNAFNVFTPTPSIESTFSYEPPKMDPVPVLPIDDNEPQK